MTAEGIFAGESDNVEFKEDIPAKSEKYMKTVVAFANGKGGKLIFGVENNTWKVTGFTTNGSWLIYKRTKKFKDRDPIEVASGRL